MRPSMDRPRPTYTHAQTTSVRAQIDDRLWVEGSHEAERKVEWFEEPRIRSGASNQSGSNAEAPAA